MSETEKDMPAAGATDEVMADWAAAMAEQGASEAKQSAEPTSSDDTRPLPMPPLEDSGKREAPGNLEMILDIPVTLSVELGRTHIQIRNLLQLAQGSVVELERLAGEPMDVLVNGYLIAQGEVVLVNDKFGIRLTDIVSPAERAKKLR